MDFEELEPRKAPAVKDISSLGIKELQDYIASLQTEIARAEAEIKKREAHRAGIEGLFKKG